MNHSLFPRLTPQDLRDSPLITQRFSIFHQQIRASILSFGESYYWRRPQSQTFTCRTSPIINRVPPIKAQFTFGSTCIHRKPFPWVGGTATRRSRGSSDHGRKSDSIEDFTSRYFGNTQQYVAQRKTKLESFQFWNITGRLLPLPNPGRKGLRERLVDTQAAQHFRPMTKQRAHWFIPTLLQPGETCYVVISVAPWKPVLMSQDKEWGLKLPKVKRNFGHLSHLPQTWGVEEINVFGFYY